MSLRMSNLPLKSSTTDSSAKHLYQSCLRRGETMFNHGASLSINKRARLVFLPYVQVDVVENVNWEPLFTFSALYTRTRLEKLHVRPVHCGTNQNIQVDIVATAKWEAPVAFIKWGTHSTLSTLSTCTKSISTSIVSVLQLNDLFF